MKLLLVLTFLALVCVARSAPTPSTNNARTIILPEYNDDDDEVLIIDDDNDMNSTTTTTTRRSTFVFPTRSRSTFPSRRPWVTQRTTTVSADEVGDGTNYFKNIGKYFKKLWEDIKKFFRNISASDVMQIIQQYFNKKSED